MHLITKEVKEFSDPASAGETLSRQAFISVLQQPAISETHFTSRMTRRKRQSEEFAREEKETALPG